MGVIVKERLWAESIPLELEGLTICGTEEVGQLLNGERLRNRLDKRRSLSILMLEDSVKGSGMDCVVARSEDRPPY